MLENIKTRLKTHGKKDITGTINSILPEQSEGNNHTSKINVFPALHTIFFLLDGSENEFACPHGVIKSTL